MVTAIHNRGDIRLVVNGNTYDLEPARPGYYNLISARTNLVVRTIEITTSINLVIRYCEQENARS